MIFGTRFYSEPLRDAFDRGRGWDGSVHRFNATASGFVAGTKVATSRGWADIEEVKAGHKVLTFDEGLQTVTGVQSEWAFTDAKYMPRAHWPLFIPAGSLGNKFDMLLLPEQAVVIESDLGEKLFGDPFTLVPAMALEGYKGIERVQPEGPMQVITLQFAKEQIVFANVGALFHCPSNATMTIAGLLDDTYTSGYEVLSLSQARMFVDAMMDEDYLDAQWIAAEQSARTKHHVA